LPTTTRAVKNTARKPVLHYLHTKAIATCQGNNRKLTIRRTPTKIWDNPKPDNGKKNINALLTTSESDL
jgi:hypothetical protein